MWFIHRTDIPSGGDNDKRGGYVAGGAGGVGKLLGLLFHFITNLKLFFKKKSRLKKLTVLKEIELTIVKLKHKEIHFQNVFLSNLE